MLRRYLPPPGAFRGQFCLPLLHQGGSCNRFATRRPTRRPFRYFLWTKNDAACPLCTLRRWLIGSEITPGAAFAEATALRCEPHKDCVLLDLEVDLLTCLSEAGALGRSPPARRVHHPGCLERISERDIMRRPATNRPRCSPNTFASARCLLGTPPPGWGSRP